MPLTRHQVIQEVILISPSGDQHTHTPSVQQFNGESHTYTGRTRLRRESDLIVRKLEKIVRAMYMVMLRLSVRARPSPDIFLRLFRIYCPTTITNRQTNKHRGLNVPCMYILYQN
eukprot:sb/3476705/